MDLVAGSLVASATPSEVDARPLAERVVELLRAHSAGLTKFKMREALHVNGQALEKALSALFGDRALTKAQAVIAGKPRDVFSLREAGS